MKIKFKKPKIKISAPKIKIAAPKIAAPKILTKVAESVGKGVKSTVDTASKVGSKLVQTVGKGAEGITANTFDTAKALAKGDFKGAAGEALQVVQSAKDVAKGTASAGQSALTGSIGTVGAVTGDKNIKKAASDIEREGQKGINTYGDAAIDVGANIATAGTYGAAKTATQSLASGGLKGLLSGKGLQDAAIAAAGSYAGYDPSMLKMGISAARGDVKEAAMQSLGSLGLSPEQIKMAQTGISAATGGKKGIASGLASYSGADAKTAELLGNVAGGGKKGIASGLASYAGAGEDTAKMIGSAATGDLRGAALAKASQAGLDPTLGGIIKKGSFDVRDLAKNANLTAAIGGVLPGQAYLPGAKNLISSGEDIARGSKEQIQLAQSFQRDGVRGVTDMATNNAAMAAGMSKEEYDKLRKDPGSQVKISAGETLSSIAKKYNMTPDQLLAANPQIKDKNKIAAGMGINLPGAGTAPTEKWMKDASGKTMYGPNGGPIANPSYDVGLADEFAGREQSKNKAPEVPGFFGRAVSGVKDFFGGGSPEEEEGQAVKTSEKKGGGFFDSVGNFVAGNKDLLGTAADAGAAYLGYQAGQEANDKAFRLSKDQLAEAQRVDTKFAGMSFDPKRYTQERKFLQDRIAGGGVTAEETKMQREGDLRAAKMAAAARASGVEQQARLGGAAMGTSALAASLAGGQSLLAEQSQSNLAREASASQKYEDAIKRQSGLSTQETMEEAQLAQNQATIGLSKLDKTAIARAEMGNTELSRGTALQNMYSSGANLVKGVIGRVPNVKDLTQNANLTASTGENLEGQTYNPAEAEAKRAAEVAKKAKADQEAAAKKNMAIKAGAAANLGSAPPATKPPSNPIKDLAGTFVGAVAPSAQEQIKKAGDMFNMFNTKK